MTTSVTKPVYLLIGEDNAILGVFSNHEFAQAVINHYRDLPNVTHAVIHGYNLDAEYYQMLMDLVADGEDPFPELAALEAEWTSQNGSETQ